MSNNPAIKKSKEYYAKNRAKLIKKTQEWRKKNRSRYLKQRRAYYANNHLRLRERAREERVKLLKMLGAECAQCKYNANILALQVDHINGDGKKDRKRFGNSIYSMCNYYLKHPDEAKKNLQVLCANCNFIKRFTNRELLTKYMRMAMRLNIFE